MAIDFTPDAKIDFTPDRDMTAPEDDDSPEAAEAKAEISGGDVVGSFLRGTAAQTYGGLAMGGKALTNALGITSGDPLETARAAAASVPSEPLTQGGQAAGGALSRGMEAADRPIERAEDYLDPTGNLKATAQDVAERGNYALAGAQAAAPLLRVPGVEVRGVPRAEPTAPAAPGGYTRADFAPAAPKPKITPKAGESAQAAAQRQGITPSAAPDHAGAPAPDIHDPGFFPAPDNQGLKSAAVGPQEQAARQAAVERGAPTLPKVRDSAITNDYNDQGRDWTGRQAGDPHAVAQTATEAQALHSEAGRISQGTGGQMGTGEAADTKRGAAYQDWHDTTVTALKGHIDRAYAAEDAAAKQIASPGSNLKGTLTNDSLIDSADAGHVRSSTIALAKQMGVDLTDPNATMNAYQVEQLRKHAGTIYGNAPRLAQAIKTAADADLPQGAYVRARALNKLKSDMFDNRDGINQLGQSKDIDPATGQPRPENRPVKAAQVMGKIENMDPGQVRHIVGTMKNSSGVLEALGDHDTAMAVTDKAHKAAQQLQSHLTERWIEEASKGGGWNTRRAHQFLNNNQETLAGVMHPDQMHQIRNVSNAANVLDLDKGYKGAFAQFRHGASWLRQRLGRTAEGLITDAIPFGNTIGEASGLSEKARNWMGGTNKAEPPKNFTRPLGETVGGGKQRGAIGNPYDNSPPVKDLWGSERVKTDRTNRAPEPRTGNPYDTGGVRPLGERVFGGKQRGAVGNLSQRDVVEHESTPRGDGNIAHQYAIPNTAKDPRFPSTTIGGINAIEYPELGVTKVQTANVMDKGKGWGTRTLQRAADDAHARGQVLHSDANVSAGQVGAYKNLAQLGYKVTEKGNTKHPGSWQAWGDHVFEVRPRESAAPLGERIGGGFQRGAVGNLRPKAEAPLDGAPEGDRPNGVARGAAAAYRKSSGIGGDPLKDYRYVQPEVAKNVADAYDAMKHDPANPKVAAAYDAFKQETLAQYKQAVKSGLKVSLDKDYPYTVPRQVHEDVRANNHMSIFPTEQGFGGPTTSGDDVVRHVQAVHYPEEKTLAPKDPKVREKYARELVGLDAGGDYKQINYPLDQIKADQPISSDVVKRYAKRDTPFPAIVMDSDGKIRDGNHRIAAARARGDKTIPTYVPIDTTTGEMAAGARPEGFDPHPLLEKAPVKMGGKDATYNDVFRAVHDYYGHVAEGNGFRANGEYNAWRAHRSMYSDAARPAMDAETLGQNSWVNSGPHAAANKGASQAATVYAEQKAGLLPARVVAAAEQGVDATQHHVTNLLTDPERQQLRADTTQRLLAAFHGAPATEEYAAAALAGAAKRGWYKNSAQAITNVMGPDAPRFSALLSSMSPQVSVETNLHNALRTFVNWDKAGRPQDPAAIRKIMEDSSQKGASVLKGKSNVLDAWVGNAVRSLTSDDPSNVKLSGPKVHSFYSNLTDHVNEVTNDAWMAAFAKIDPAKLGGSLNASGPGKSASYLALSAKVRGAAAMLSKMTGEAWTPREVQETVWSWAKAAYEHAEETGDRSIPELVKNGAITDDLIKSTPDFHQLFSSPQHRGLLQSSRYAANAERVAGWKGEGSNSADAGKARAAAAKTLRPHLLSASERLEALRQERNAGTGEEAPF